MNNVTWELRPEDTEFFQRELDAFVPPRVYDIHAHLWRIGDWQGNPPVYARVAPPEITAEVYKEHIAWILPGREVHALHLPYPATFPNDTDGPNEWAGEQVRKDPLSRGHFYVRPTDDPDWARQEIKRLGLRGFKPFANFAGRPDIANAEIPEFFPEWMARVAHEEGWSITLHQMRARSLADPSNLRWIRTYCTKYPRMTLILDHCARGFNPYHLIEGLTKLEPQTLPNLYADTSACCSPLAAMACLRYLGPERVMFGSDFYICHLRGSNFPIGDSFIWLEEPMPVWDAVIYGKPPVLLGLENLQAVKAAFHMLRLGDREIELYFWGNAARILGL